MNYQAVIRDGSNQLVKNQSVGMQISILQGSVNGVPVYVETHTKSTNANGLLTVVIGGGQTVSGNMGGIDWSNGPYYLKTETDPTGGSNYTITGTSRFMSVPYAMHAKTAESIQLSGNESAFNGWDKNASDDFSGNFDDLSNKPFIPGPVTGTESAFNAWDKNASDDFSGNYNDLTNKPFIPGPITGGEPVFNAWDKNASDDFSGNYNDLTNKPTIPGPVTGTESAFNAWDKNASDDFSGNYNDLTNKPTIPGPVTGTESAFNGWDKNASDDFSGDYNDLINKPGFNSNTLDEAYDEGGAGAGRIINADNGPVEIRGFSGLEVDGPTQFNGSIGGRVPGIAHNYKLSNVPLPNTSPSEMRDIVTVSITIPGPGYIVVQANGMLNMNADRSTYFQIDDTQGGDTKAGYIWEYSSAASSNSIYHQKVYYKSGPATYTFRLEARIGAPYVGGELERYIYNSSITATYHPVAHGTVNIP